MISASIWGNNFLELKSFQPCILFIAGKISRCRDLRVTQLPVPPLFSILLIKPHMPAACQPIFSRPTDDMLLIVEPHASTAVVCQFDKMSLGSLRCQLSTTWGGPRILGLHQTLWLPHHRVNRSFQGLIILHLLSKLDLKHRAKYKSCSTSKATNMLISGQALFHVQGNDPDQFLTKIAASSSFRLFRSSC